MTFENDGTSLQPLHRFKRGCGVSYPRAPRASALGTHGPDVEIFASQPIARRYAATAEAAELHVMEEGEGRPPAGDGWTAALELDRAPESRQASAARSDVDRQCSADGGQIGACCMRRGPVPAVMGSAAAWPYLFGCV